MFEYLIFNNISISRITINIFNTNYIVNLFHPTASWGLRGPPFGPEQVLPRAPHLVVPGGLLVAFFDGRAAAVFARMLARTVDLTEEAIGKRN